MIYFRCDDFLCTLCAICNRIEKIRLIFLYCRQKLSRKKSFFVTLYNCSWNSPLLFLKMRKIILRKIPLDFLKCKHQNLSAVAQLLIWNFTSVFNIFPRLDFFINQNVKKAFKGLNWKITKSFFPLKFFV